jgi:peptidoglycan/xylan/chitin deacetylase (PgdA/CDA1 family)
MDRSEAENLTGVQKNEIAALLAQMLGVDYNALCAKRILHLMTRDEVANLAAQGVDIQLHTHRHRTPENEELFRLEIRDNRQSLPEAAKQAQHFCYPAGVYRRQFLGWLQAESVISATTCDVALSTRQSDPLLLPRFVDTTKRTAVEFESWLTGVGDLLAFRRAATQQYSPQGD